MRITLPDDAGNIDVLSIGPAKADLAVRDDNAAAFRQWFNFDCEDARGAELRIVNAGRCTYAAGFAGYRVCRNEGAGWVRAPATYHDGVLSFRVGDTDKPVSFAYFEPYPRARHQARCTLWRSRAHLVSLGSSVDGADLTCVTIGTGKLPVWVIARQHPGETMGEWFAEGFLDRLCGDPAHDSQLADLLQLATVHVVPCMNPDGARRGNHRTNAAGADLNRAWHDPDPAVAPEVRVVRDRMDQTGVAVALDIHGDETIPYAFAAGGAGVPSFTEARANAEAHFLHTWATRCADFQTEHGYPRPAPGQANLTVCTKQLAERFGCLSLTIEQPFLDNADHPDEHFGWSGARSAKLGASLVDVLPTALASA